MDVGVIVALLGATATIMGYFITNSLERRQAVRVREMEFRLDRYKEFFVALSEQTGFPTYETHLRFVSAVNTIVLIGGPRLLVAFKELVDNYNKEASAEDDQEAILNRIVFEMRQDLTIDNAGLAEFEFPVIRPDTSLYPQTNDASNPKLA